jgi:hypothetical protein
VGTGLYWVVVLYVGEVVVFLPWDVTVFVP